MRACSSNAAPAWLIPALLLVMAAALGIRLVRVGEWPADFHPARQYGAAMVARALYFESKPDVPDWMRDVTRAQRAQVQRVEPPVMEWISSKVYTWMGSENMAVPRLIAILSWMVGAVFLFLLACRFLPGEGALLATAFFLLRPFSVTLSRSLQPDSMAIMGLLAFVWAAWRYFEKPAFGRLAACAVLGGLAIVIKPGSTQFTVLAVFVAMMWNERGLRQALASRDAWLFLVLAAAPVAAYLPSALANQSSYEHVLSINFLPSLWFTVYFWKGWAGNLLQVLGLIGLLLGLAGLFLLPAGRARAMAAGWVAGYAVQCLLTTYTTASHDYWHAQAVPLFALGLGAVSVPVWRWAATFVPPRALGATAAAGLLLWGFVTLRSSGLLLERTGSADFPELAREIGRAVGHSTRTVFLDHDDGSPACYFGLYAGRWWHQTGDFAFDEARRGMARVPAEQRFRESYAALNPEYFIVRDLRDFDRQPDLKEFLDRTGKRLAQSDRYLVYDLRGQQERSPRTSEQ